MPYCIFFHTYCTFNSYKIVFKEVLSRDNCIIFYCNVMLYCITSTFLYYYLFCFVLLKLKPLLTTSFRTLYYTYLYYTLHYCCVIPKIFCTYLYFFIEYMYLRVTFIEFSSIIKPFSAR